ncbi:YqiJ family protein [Flocculibacter collagenilyticus]|uniref:YqiJ family protein n=1 Tax=Flocculibacter collagenilyticus TaxID=2744479 RepID=UPI0018F30880|nr:YqiJ family protein [Flocculibacter collagenilyticus]
MFEFIFSNQNIYFTVALGIMCVIGLIEGIGMLIGASILSILDNLLDVDVDMDADSSVTEGGLTAILGWLCLDKLPLLVWLTLLLVSFALVGYSLNFTSHHIFSQSLSTFISIPIATIAALFSTHWLGAALAKVMPKNESSAVSKNTFSGQVGTITIGTAKQGYAAEAVVTDHFKQKHYVMVEPAIADDEFTQGTQVLLIDKKESVWLATKYNA